MMAGIRGALLSIPDEQMLGEMDESLTELLWQN